jgi:predicted helicase
MQLFIHYRTIQNLIANEKKLKMLSNFSAEETFSSSRQHINKATSNIHGDAINSNN